MKEKNMMIHKNDIKTILKNDIEKTHKNDIKKKNLEIGRFKKIIKKIKKESKIYKTYKKLVLNCAKSKNDPADIVEGLRFATKNIKAKRWNIVDRMAIPSGNLNVRGVCPTCGINLFGKNIQPLESSLPCGVEGCLFERQNNSNGSRPR